MLKVTLVDLIPKNIDFIRTNPTKHNEMLLSVNNGNKQTISKITKVKHQQIFELDINNIINVTKDKSTSIPLNISIQNGNNIIASSSYMLIPQQILQSRQQQLTIWLVLNIKQPTLFYLTEKNIKLKLQFSITISKHHNNLSRTPSKLSTPKPKQQPYKQLLRKNISSSMRNIFINQNITTNSNHKHKSNITSSIYDFYKHTKCKEQNKTINTSIQKYRHIRNISDNILHDKTSHENDNNNNTNGEFQIDPSNINEFTFKNSNYNSSEHHNEGIINCLSEPHIKSPPPSPQLINNNKYIQCYMKCKDEFETLISSSSSLPKFQCSNLDCMLVIRKIIEMYNSYMKSFVILRKQNKRLICMIYKIHKKYLSLQQKLFALNALKDNDNITSLQYENKLIQNKINNDEMLTTIMNCIINYNK